MSSARWSSFVWATLAVTSSLVLPACTSAGADGAEGEPSASEGEGTPSEGEGNQAEGEGEGTGEGEGEGDTPIAHCPPAPEPSPSGFVESRCLLDSCFDSALSFASDLAVTSDGTIYVAAVTLHRIENGRVEESSIPAVRLSAFRDELWTTSTDGVRHIKDGVVVSGPHNPAGLNPFFARALAADATGVFLVVPGASPSSLIVIHVDDAGTISPIPLTVGGAQLTLDDSQLMLLEVDGPRLWLANGNQVFVDDTQSGDGFTRVPIPAGDLVNCIDVEGADGYAVGANCASPPAGVVLRLSEGAFNEEALPGSPTPIGVLGSVRLTADRVVAGGDEGVVLTRSRTDERASWTLASPPEPEIALGSLAVIHEALFLSALAGDSSLLAAQGNGNVFVVDVDAGSLSSLTGSVADLYDVHGLADDDVWAVGAHGTSLHYDGHRWTPFQVATSADLVGVHERAPDDVWAIAGDTGYPDVGPVPDDVFHFDGTSWQPTGFLFHDALLSVTTTGSTVVIGAENGVYETPDGASFTPLKSRSLAFYRRVWASADGAQIVAVGDDEIFGPEGSVSPSSLGAAGSWGGTSVDGQAGQDGEIVALGLDHSASGSAAFVYHASTGWQPLPLPTGEEWEVVSVHDASDVWVATQFGRAAELHGFDQTEIAFGAHSLFTAPSGTLFSVGEDGQLTRILRQCN